MAEIKRYLMAMARHSTVPLMCLMSAGVQAADIALVGLLPGRALVVIDGGKRQTVSVGGMTTEGVKLISIESGMATFEAEGRRRSVKIGQSVVSTASSERPNATLVADGQGHFLTQGSINGKAIRFLVDTGATFVALGASDAARAGIDPRQGTPGVTMTANGPARVWRVKLSSVKVGAISLAEVDATVHEQDMPFALLGMSFLNRMEINRDGQTMTLKQRY